MVSPSEVPAALGWVVSFLNTADLRTFPSARPPRIRDELTEPDEAATWLRDQGFAGSTGDLPAALVGLRAVREDVRQALAGERPLRAIWAARIELVRGSTANVRPASSSPAAWAEAKLLTAFLSPQMTRLRVCAAADCRRAFYDRSKNGRGRWCSAANCGNRMKTRAYRQRQREQPVPPRADTPQRAPVARTLVFRPEGDFWTIGPLRATFRLKDSKGLAYLARLLAEPMREFHVLELAGAGSRASRPGTPLLDAEAVRRYKDRLESLRDEIEEAEAWNDGGRAATAREELEAVSAELARTGFHGRSRTFASDSERARIAVTRVIKAALTRIGERSPELRHHFALAIRTGTYCSYRPDPRLPVRWEL